MFLEFCAAVCGETTKLHVVHFDHWDRKCPTLWNAMVHHRHHKRPATRCPSRCHAICSSAVLRDATVRGLSPA